MLILARADDRLRALSREATPAVERINTREIGGGEVSRERRERIYDSVVSSFRHDDRANDRGAQLRCRWTVITRTRAFDIPVAVPDYVRPLLTTARATIQ